MTDYTNRLLCGDSAQILKTLPDNLVDLTVTSPPYDNRREYDNYNFDFETIAKELFRVTKDGGVVVWVVGDATINGDETGTSFKQALFFKEVGFKLHDTMIYQKNSYPPNCMAVNRYAQVTEYMFVFVKNEIKTFNRIMRQTNHGGKKKGIHSKTQVDGKLKKYGRNASEFYNKETVAYNVWVYNTGTASGDDIIAFEHPAPFPENLARDHIQSWSNEGDLVLDPMMGSGTTGKMARMLKRNFIGIEISERYFEIAKRRCSVVQEVINN
jgi:site-specific DNA-methyltransferase (adenine-specific)